MAKKLNVGKEKGSGKAERKPGSKSKTAPSVEDFMKDLDHPLKKEMESLRKILKGSDKAIKERIKWNAPSYYVKNDIVTFNPRTSEHIHLVFHHPKIDTVSSTIFEGDYKGRKMAYFKNSKEIRAAKNELTSIMKRIVELDNER